MFLLLAFFFVTFVVIIIIIVIVIIVIFNIIVVIVFLIISSSTLEKLDDNLVKLFCLQIENVRFRHLRFDEVFGSLHHDTYAKL
jgi:hypothetical protein